LAGAAGSGRSRNGFALAGPTADAIGLDTTLFAAAALSVVVHFAVIAMPSARNLRREDDATTREPRPSVSAAGE
jgi:hypothetical protein